MFTKSFSISQICTLPERPIKPLLERLHRPNHTLFIKMSRYAEIDQSLHMSKSEKSLHKQPIVVWILPFQPTFTCMISTSPFYSFICCIKIRPCILPLLWHTHLTRQSEQSRIFQLVLPDLENIPGKQVRGKRPEMSCLIIFFIPVVLRPRDARSLLPLFSAFIIPKVSNLFYKAWRAWVSTSNVIHSLSFFHEERINLHRPELWCFRNIILVPFIAK